jgi:hypothetical protein
LRQFRWLNACIYRKKKDSIQANCEASKSFFSSALFAGILALPISPTVWNRFATPSSQHVHGLSRTGKNEKIFLAENTDKDKSRSQPRSEFKLIVRVSTIFQHKDAIFLAECIRIPADAFKRSLGYSIFRFAQIDIRHPDRRGDDQISTANINICACRPTRARHALVSKSSEKIHDRTSDRTSMYQRR